MVPRSTSSDSATILVALRRVVRFLRLTDRDVERACGLSAAQLFVLQQLAPGPVPSLARLATLTMTDQSSVSTVAARLVSRGLVARSTSKSDGRRAELRLTPAGKRLLRSAPVVPQTMWIKAIEMMPPARRRQLATTLESLVRLLGAKHVAPHMLFEDEPRRRKR